MTLQTLSTANRWNLFKIQGQLDFASAPTVVTGLLHAAALDHSHLLIDLEDLTSADDIGISKFSSAVGRLLSERPSLNIAIIAKDAALADAIGRTQLPAAVVIFRNAADALKAIGLDAAA